MSKLKIAGVSYDYIKPKLLENQTDRVYHSLLVDILKNGILKTNRTGELTYSVFGRQLRFKNVGDIFPVLTTKRVPLRSVMGELLWFLSGNTNKFVLRDKYKCTIWDEWNAPYTTNREVITVETKHREYIEYNGNFSTTGYSYLKDEDLKLIKTWIHMMERCYKEDAHNHKFYIDSSVCKEWHDPLKFIEDVKKLPHWRFKKDDWQNWDLDKDYYNSNLYSSDTCVWLSKEENNKYKKTGRDIKVTFPNGESKIFLSRYDVVKEIGISSGTLCRTLDGFVPTIHKQGTEKFAGFIFEDITDCDINYRYKLIEDGEMGPIYGYQWRNFNSSGIDQMTNILNTLKTNPDDRRMIVTAWNPQQLSQQALPPCHWSFQFNTNVIEGQEKRTIDLMMNQRSVDTFLGLPFNIASYAFLLLMVADQVDMIPGDLIMNLGDCHIYQNHLPFVTELLQRESKFTEIDNFGEVSGVSPQIELNKVDSLYNYTPDDFRLINYNPHPNFKDVPIAV